MSTLATDVYSECVRLTRAKVPYAIEGRTYLAHALLDKLLVIPEGDPMNTAHRASKIVLEIKNVRNCFSSWCAIDYVVRI